MSIKAIFPAGVTALTVNGLHQWDYGQTLEIQAEGLPRLVEVHFACTGMSEAVVRLCEVVDGKTSAVIPDVCLEQRSPVVAWVYEIDEDGGKTVLTVTMPVIARIKPPAGTSSPKVADQYAQLLTLYGDLLDGWTSGEVPVGRAFEADHAAEADEADHATKADEADHATEADKAKGYVGVLPVENGGTGVSSMDALFNALGLQYLTSRAVVEGGTYTGTGTSGAVGVNEPCALTFGFTPRLVIINAVSDDHGIPLVLIRGVTRMGDHFYTGSSIQHGSVSVTWSDNTVSWSSPGAQYTNIQHQKNVKDVRYQYICIGTLEG